MFCFKLHDFFCSFLVFVGSITVKILFILHPPLSFSSSMIGYYLSISMLYKGIGVVGGMPIFIRKMKLNDYTMVIIGCFSTLAMFVSLAFATKVWIVFAGRCQFAFSCILLFITLLLVCSYIELGVKWSIGINLIVQLQAAKGFQVLRSATK